MIGTAVKGVAILGEHDWDLRHPMVDRLLRRAGLDRKDFVWGAAHEPSANVESLSAAGVKVVVALGERALQSVLGERDILRWRGRAVTKPTMWGDLVVVPMLQPSKLMSGRSNEDEADALRHPPRFHGVWVRDLHFALQVAEHGFERMPVHYVLDPPPLRLQQFADEYEAALRDDPDTMLSWDIETPYKAKNDDEEELEEKELVLDGVILRTSFCFKPGYAISVPWSPDYRATIARLLASKGQHVVWNGRTFDVPVVEKDGMQVRGTIIDGMDLYHLYQSDLPKGLEWVTAEATDLLPWKHLSQVQDEAAHYNAIDADAALRNVLYLRERLRSQGRWELFLNHVVRLMPVLDQAAQQGNLIDRAKRDEIRSGLLTMRDTLVTELQQYVPRELLPRTEYKRQPEEVPGAWDISPFARAAEQLDGWDVVWVREEVKQCSACKAFASNKTEHFKGTTTEGVDKKGKPKTVRVPNACKVAGGELVKVPAYVPHFFRLELFNPNSSDQLKAYMRHFGHPLGKDKKNAQKETADAGHLKMLHKKVGKKFPLYSKTLVVHKVSKTIGTYTPEPDECDILHTQFVNSTSSWRLGARKVQHGTQIQNWGKRKDEVPTESEEERAALKLATQAREQIVARPGHVLIQIDSSAVEAVMQGYYMNDPDYMNLASQSIHAWLTCRQLGWAFTPENVDRVKKEHPGLYAKFKVTNYLCLTPGHEMLTPHGWVKVEDYDGTTPIAEWAPDGAMQFRAPQHWLAKPYKGELFVLNGKSLQAEATPKHAFPGRTDNRGPYTRRLVDDLGPNHRVPFTGRLEGPQTVDLSMLRLMVSAQADGHVLPSGAVRWTLRKPRKVARLRELLGGRPFYERAAGPNTVVSVKAPDIADVVALLGPEKTFNEGWLLGLTLEARKAFIDELQEWDGDTASVSPQRCYRTMNARNAEIAQTVAHTVGLQGVRYLHHTTGLWSVSFNGRQETRLREGQKTTRHYEGLVYCPTTSTGYFLYRFNGVIAVSGNTNFGGGPALMAATYPDEFPTRAAAEATQQSLYELLPTLKEYHHSVRWEAHTKGYLETPWGYRHYYYDVYRKNEDGSLALSKDSKRCVAFKPQNSNAGFQKDNLLLTAVSPLDGPAITDIGWATSNWDTLWAEAKSGRTWLRYMPTNVTIHDSLCLDIPKSLEAHAAQSLLAIFTRPIPQMNGLQIGAEVEVGPNWAHMDLVGRKVMDHYTAAQTASGLPKAA